MKQKDPKLDELLIGNIEQCMLSEFARLNTGVTLALGSHAHPSSVEFAQRVADYLQDGKLTAEGIEYLKAEIHGSKLLKENYQRFARGIGEEIAKRYD
jgi:hypothetical protein